MSPSRSISPATYARPRPSSFGAVTRRRNARGERTTTVAGAPATVVVRSPRALRRLVTAPNELGLGRAYVAGEIDLDGDIFAVLALQDRLEDLKVTPTQVMDALRI